MRWWWLVVAFALGFFTYALWDQPKLDIDCSYSANSHLGRTDCSPGKVRR